MERIPVDPAWGNTQTQAEPKVKPKPKRLTGRVLHELEILIELTYLASQIIDSK
jgi:hypothetical protein